MKFEIDDFCALKDALQRMCDALLAVQVPPDLVFDSKVVASELIANVLQHGSGRAIFTVERQDDAVVLHVRGGGTFCPPETSVCPDVTAERGRGLFLVDALCSERCFSDEEGVGVVLRLKTTTK